MYQNDNDIMNRLQEHLDYALSVYNMDWFVLCVQGSWNYGMTDEDSDVDTKLLVIPSLEDIVLNRKPISHTLEMPDNQEHVDVKDAREYFKIFRKSNINFVEILFTKYYIVNEAYEDIWNALVNRNEELARINPYAAISCMGGMAAEKYYALQHEYPSRMTWIEKYGFDPKQLHHLLRIEGFLEDYLQSKPYQECIYPTNEQYRQKLLNIKRVGLGLSAEDTVDVASAVKANIDNMVSIGRNTYNNELDEELDEFLNNQLYRLISRSIKGQLHD